MTKSGPPGLEKQVCAIEFLSHSEATTLSSQLQINILYRSLVCDLTLLSKPLRLGLTNQFGRFLRNANFNRQH